MDKQDKSSLENAIRDEARRVIADIARKEAEEMKRLDAEHAAELEEFQQEMEAQTDDKISPGIFQGGKQGQTRPQEAQAQERRGIHQPHC